MEKNVIEVVLQPEVKEEKEPILILLFRKKKFILYITLIGLIAGIIISPLYYLRETRRAAKISSEQDMQQPDIIISENLYDRQFLTQSTREREPGNLNIAEQLSYDLFLVKKTMNDIVFDLSFNNNTTLKTIFETFQAQAIKKINLIEEAFPSKYMDNINEYPYLLVNDDQEVLKAKVQENQYIIDIYDLAITDSADKVDYADIFLKRTSLIKKNEIIEQIIQGNITNDPDKRGTQVVFAQIDELCSSLDEVKMELLNIIDKHSAPNLAPAAPPSLLKLVAIGAVFPCMMFVAAILLVILSDWWHKFIEEQNVVKK